MKPIFLKKNTQNAEESFFSRYAEVPHTYDHFHYHKEFELLFNIQNNGTRFVGDSIEPFFDGDLVLVGPNIPHYWRSDLSYYNENSNKLAKVICIHFVRDFAGVDFFSIPEMQNVATLLEKARYGISFPVDKTDKAKEYIFKLVNETGWKKVIFLISVLNELAEIKGNRLLATIGFCQAFYRRHDEEKISDIYNFLVRNHDQNLNLFKVAEHANMNPSAFCRYFKNATNRTFSEALNEIRIGIACRNLINTSLSISQIAYTCGYQYIPYFNRQFLKIKKCTPLEFRQKYKSPDTMFELVTSSDFFK
jgi:AraC-like DNA-binding protein